MIKRCLYRRISAQPLGSLTWILKIRCEAHAMCFQSVSSNGVVDRFASHRAWRRLFFDVRRCGRPGCRQWLMKSNSWFSPSHPRLRKKWTWLFQTNYSCHWAQMKLSLIHASFCVCRPILAELFWLYVPPPNVRQIQFSWHIVWRQYNTCGQYYDYVSSRLPSLHSLRTEIMVVGSRPASAVAGLRAIVDMVEGPTVMKYLRKIHSARLLRSQITLPQSWLIIICICFPFSIQKI